MKAKISISFFFVFCTIFYTSSFAKDAKEDKWQEYKTNHFIIYYKDAPRDFIRSVEETAEHYYHEITQNLGFTRYEHWTWEERAKIYIYRDFDDYVHSAREAPWSHGAASARERTIRTFPAAHGFFDSTLPHELGHIIFREFVGFKSHIPLWFDEGVAMYQEKAKRWGANRFVQQAIQDKKFVPLSELSQVGVLNEKTERFFVDLFYAESASIVYYLITELGKYKFVNFCKLLKEGNDFDKALALAYVRFESLEDLNRVWLNYLKR